MRIDSLVENCSFSQHVEGIVSIPRPVWLFIDWCIVLFFPMSSFNCRRDRVQDETNWRTHLNRIPAWFTLTSERRLKCRVSRTKETSHCLTMTMMVMVIYNCLFVNVQRAASRHCFAATDDTRCYNRTPDVQTGMELRVAIALGTCDSWLFARFLIPPVTRGPLAWPSSFLCLHALSHPSPWPASWTASGMPPCHLRCQTWHLPPFPRPCDCYMFRGKHFLPLRIFSGSCLYHCYSGVSPWWCFYSFLVLDSWCPFFTWKFCHLALENYFVTSFENVFPSIFFVFPPPPP